jgi:hypothetical protein
MRFVGDHHFPEFVDAIFEVDPDTNFSEQFVAMNALGAYALAQKDPKDRGAVSYLAANIRNAEALEDSQDLVASEKPKEVVADFTPQNAHTLIEALLHYASSTNSDLGQFAMTNNYQAITARIVEQDMAEQMAAELELKFQLLRVNKPNVPFGFSRVLAETS